MGDAFTTMLWLMIWAGQIMAIVVCFKKESPQWLKICGWIWACLFMLAFIWAARRYG